MDFLDQVQQNLTLDRISIEEFCESDEYCNKPLYPRQRILLKLVFLEELTPKEEDILDYWIKGGRNGTEITISPLIRERVQYLREHDYSHFREVVLVGGRRSSKGFCTALAMAKVLHDALQLQDPGKHYGIDTDKEIYYSCVAASQDQAKKYQYADLASAVGSCKALQPHLTKLQETEFSIATPADQRKMKELRRHNKKIQRDTSKLRGAAFAANAATIRGSATMAICFDEMAHMQTGESHQSAEEVYAAAEPALDQFAQDAIIFCNSSPYTKLGKFYQRYEQGLVVEDNEAASPTMMVFQFPSWALFEDWQSDPNRKFRKCITVSPDWDPEKKDQKGEPYHSKEDQQAILIARQSEKQNPDKYKVERRGRFAEIIDAYLKPEMVDRMYQGVPAFENGEWLHVPFFTNWRNSTYMHQYRAHLDPSSTTAGFGFALGHSEFFKNEKDEDVEHVVFDIIKRWEPQKFPNSVIDWEVVLEEVFGYIDIFRPTELTFDQFQSHAPIQWLQAQVRDNGIETRVFEKTATAETNWHRAETFKTALYMDLVHGPNDTEDAKYSGEELKYLQEIRTGRTPRVDKQDIGPVQTKDMADCIMTVTEALIGNVIARHVRFQMAGMMRLGGEGGYPIGGVTRGGKARSNPMSDFYHGRTGEQRTPGSSSPREQVMNPARMSTRLVRAGMANGRRMPRRSRGF